MRLKHIAPRHARAPQCRPSQDTRHPAAAGPTSVGSASELARSDFERRSIVRLLLSSAGFSCVGLRLLLAAAAAVRLLVTVDRLLLFGPLDSA